MKKTIPLTALALFGLASVPAIADTLVKSDKPATEQAAAAKKVPAYVIVVSGKGWGVATKASSAINAQEGVKTILLSGYRATVIMEDGKELDKKAVTKAIVGKGLKVKSYEKSEIATPEIAYTLKVTGTGWAIENDKARVALEKLDGITAAFVNKGISLHYTADGSFDKEAIAKVLKPYKMEIQEVTKLDKLPF